MSASRPAVLHAFWPLLLGIGVLLLVVAGESAYYLASGRSFLLMPTSLAVSPDGQLCVYSLGSSEVHVFQPGSGRVRSWRVDTRGGDASLSVRADSLEIASIRNRTRFVYTLSGELVSSRGDLALVTSFVQARKASLPDGGVAFIEGEALRIRHPSGAIETLVPERPWPLSAAPMAPRSSVVAVAPGSLCLLMAWALRRSPPAAR